MLTYAQTRVIIIGFARNSVDLDNSLMEVLQVVCRMDDRPKTDRFVNNSPMQVGNKFK